MGTVYLIDAHNPTLLSSGINDTVNVQTGQTCTLRGSFPVNVPFDVPIDGGLPTNLGDLITKKYAGLLSLYPGFQNIVYNACVDGAGWNPGFAGPGASPTTSAVVGSRQTTSLSHFTISKLESDLVALAYTPATVIMRWELFKYVSTNVVGGVMTRVYEEVDPDTAGVTVTATFVNLQGTAALSNGVLFEVPLDRQGDQFRFRIANSSSQKLWLGSWALIY